MVRNLPAKAKDVRDAGWIPGSGRSLEEGMATHSSIISWRIPWTEEPGGLQSTESKRVGRDGRDLADMHTCIVGLHTMFQVYSKVIQLYVSLFFFRFLSITGYKILNTVLCAVDPCLFYIPCMYLCYTVYT